MNTQSPPIRPSVEHYERTTVEIRGLRKLRVYLMKTDRTLKQFLNEALYEKLLEEELERKK